MAVLDHPSNYMKGKWCPYRNHLWCQEGWCASCEVWRLAGLSRDKEIANLNTIWEAGNEA